MGPMSEGGYKILNFEEMHAAILKMSAEERARLLQVLLKYEAVEIQMKKDDWVDARNRIFFRGKK